jgi:hypothetical protein
MKVNECRTFGYRRLAAGAADEQRSRPRRDETNNETTTLKGSNIKKNESLTEILKIK